MRSSIIQFKILRNILSDQGVPMVNYGKSAMLAGPVTYTAIQHLQPLPCRLCSPLGPTYDVNSHERPPT